MRDILCRFFFVLLFLSGMENRLFGQAPNLSGSGQDINQLSGSYSFFEENTGKSGSLLTKKEDSFFSDVNSWSPKKKAIAINGVIYGVTIGVGVVTWDHFSSSFHFLDEGWFEQGSGYGGADKLGHAFSGYVLSDIYYSIYKNIGYSEKQANNLGALSAWSLMTFIEVGDGFSKDYGFSLQDETMNTIGVALSYFRNKYPALKEIFDYRLEWWPSNYYKDGNSDPFTDYSGQKNLIALKPAGIFHSDNELLKAVNLNIGFYTRGYEDDSHTDKRYLFFGVGLDITYILKELTGWNAWGVFDYFQMPFTYIPVTKELD
jgi:hypothetical protein